MDQHMVGSSINNLPYFNANNSPHWNHSFGVFLENERKMSLE